MHDCVDGRQQLGAVTEEVHGAHADEALQYPAVCDCHACPAGEVFQRAEPAGRLALRHEVLDRACSHVFDGSQPEPDRGFAVCGGVDLECHVATA